MRTAYGLIFRPWDFIGEAGSLLDRALGEIGFDALIVPAVTGPQERFRPEPDSPPHTFMTEGGWHFPVRTDAYQTAAAKPRVAKWCGKRDVLEKIRNAAAQRDVRLILEIDLRAVDGLLEHEPHLRGRDAWGEVPAAAGPCVLNPDLRELLRATLADLARYEPAGWRLVDWMADLAPSGTPRTTFTWHPLLAQLLDVCFCPACRQTAEARGVDPDAAAEAVRRMTASLMEEPTLDLSVLASGNLREYLEVRRRDVADWLQRLGESFPGQNFHMRTPLRAVGDPWLLARTAFELLPSAFMPVFAQPAFSPSFIPPPGVSAYGRTFPVWQPDFSQADALVKAVNAAAKGDAAAIDASSDSASHVAASLLEFEGLDTAPRAALDWLRLAVRYARRG